MLQVEKLQQLLYYNKKNKTKNESLQILIKYSERKRIQ